MAIPALTANTPSTGHIRWAAFTIRFGNVSYSVVTGSTSSRFVWWRYNAGAPLLQAGDDLPTDLTIDDLVLFGNKNGTPVNLQTAGLVEGGLIVEGSILADALAANSVTAEKILAHSVDATHIVAHSITANEIAANSITANEIAANTITTSELNVEDVNANTIQAMEAYFGSIKSNFVFVDGKIIIGNENAAHIEIDPAKGLLMFGPDGTTVLVKLDMTSAQVSEFTGKINATEVAVLRGLELRSALSRIMNEAVMTLVNTTASPTSQPTLTEGLNTQKWLAPPAGYTETGLWWDGTNWSQILYNGGNDRTRIRSISPAGVEVPLSSDGWLILGDHMPVGGYDNVFQAAGLVRVGASFFTLRRDGPWDWYLVKYNATTGAAQGSVKVAEVYSLEARTAPALGYDGTNLIVAVNSGAQNWITPAPNHDDNEVMQLWNPTTLAAGAKYTVDGGVIFDVQSLRFVGRGNFDYGSSKVVVAGAHEVKVYTLSGTTLTPDTAFSSWMMDAGTNKVLAWNGSNFFSSSDSNVLKKYSGFLGTSVAQRRFWARYAWESGASATLPSPAQFLSLTDRRYLNVGLPEPGAGTNLTRVFTGQGASQPANAAMYSRGTTAGTSVQYESHVATGANPRTASDFTTGTPALLTTQGGELPMELWGSGEGHWLGQAQPHVRLRLNANQPLATGGGDVVVTGWTTAQPGCDLTSQLNDVDDDFTVSGGNITVRYSGVYNVSAVVAFTGNASSYRTAKMRLNGTSIADDGETPGNAGGVWLRPTMAGKRLAAGDVISVTAGQNAVANLPLLAVNTWLSITRISA